RRRAPPRSACDSQLAVVVVLVDVVVVVEVQLLDTELLVVLLPLLLAELLLGKLERRAQWHLSLLSRLSTDFCVSAHTGNARIIVLRSARRGGCTPGVGCAPAGVALQAAGWE